MTSTRWSWRTRPCAAALCTSARVVAEKSEKHVPSPRTANRRGRRLRGHCVCVSCRAETAPQAWRLMWGELRAGVLDGEHRALGLNAGSDADGPLFGQVVDD